MERLVIVSSTLKVPVSSTGEGEVSQASYNAIGSKRKEIQAFEKFQIARHLEVWIDAHAITHAHAIAVAQLLAVAIKRWCLSAPLLLFCCCCYPVSLLSLAILAVHRLVNVPVLLLTTRDHPVLILVASTSTLTCLTAMATTMQARPTQVWEDKFLISGKLFLFICSPTWR